MTAPYPWPYDGPPDSERLALLAVGCQGWWAERTDDSDRYLDSIVGMAQDLRELGVSVIWARSGGPGNSPDRPRRVPAIRRWGWDLLVEPAHGDILIDSPGTNAFFGSSLNSHLRAAGIRYLAIAGLGVESTVYSTLTAANDRGFECLTLTDGCAPHTPAVAARALLSITMSGGIFGATGTAAELIRLVNNR